MWKSQAYDYAGRFLFEVVDEAEANTLIDFGVHELRIYNSAGDKANEIWIEDHNHKIPLKSLFVISGEAKGFKSAASGFEAQTNNLYRIEPVDEADKSKLEAPTAEGQTASVDRKAVRAEILTAKIEPKAYETLGKNKADKLYMKVRLYNGKVHFVSVQKPKDEWEKPDTPEFKWVFKNTENLKQHTDVVIRGHRFTGFAEDVYPE